MYRIHREEANRVPPVLREYEGLYIGGHWVAVQVERRSEVLNPATESVIARAPVGDREEACAAIGAARAAFDDGPWPHLSPAERSAVLQRFHDALATRADELRSLIVAEIGAAQSVATALHIDTSLRILQTTINLNAARPRFIPLPTILVPNRRGTRTLGSTVKVREPAGVVTAITPFNFPLLLNLVKLGPALAAGCTMVLKPSPLTPLQALLLGDIAGEIGLPDGVLNIVTGGAEVGELLTTDGRVDLVTFTGSDSVGASVMAQASPTIKRVLLELGGKSAMIVRADADVATAASAGVDQIVVQAGQGCALHTRHLVHRAVYDEYVAAAAATAARVTVGDPADPTVMMGPLINDAQRARVERYVAEGLAAGANVVAGGRRPPGLDRGFFYEPTLLAGVDNSMTVAQEEIFGPVGVIIPFDDDDDAVRIANDSHYGLSGAVWSADAGPAFELALRLRTGNVSINGGAGGLNPMAPFGGYKRSGIGREFGEEGLDEYTELKSISFHAG
ncbi:MAG: aldehyde dehydrogenase family protein [Acidimicrobiales bacterium]